MISSINIKCIKFYMDCIISLLDGNSIDTWKIHGMDQPLETEGDFIDSLVVFTSIINLVHLELLSENMHQKCINNK